MIDLDIMDQPTAVKDNPSDLEHACAVPDGDDAEDVLPAGGAGKTDIEVENLAVAQLDPSYAAISETTKPRRRRFAWKSVKRVALRLYSVR